MAAAESRKMTSGFVFSTGGEVEKRCACEVCVSVCLSVAASDMLVQFCTHGRLCFADTGSRCGRSRSCR